jgi:hypothetical protein
MTFNDFNRGDAIDSITFGDGTTATVTTNSNRPVSQGGTDQAVIFDTDNPTGNDTDLGSPFEPASGSGGLLEPGNVLIIAGPDNGLGLPDDDLRGGTITFDFDREVDIFSFVYLDTEERTGLTVTTDTGFNSGLLTTGDGEYGRFTAPILGIRSITFELAGSGAVDDLEIGGIVPVPASLPLLLTGLGLFGWLGRRRAT